MSKFTATKVYQSFLPDNEVAISFVTNNRYLANQVVNELKHLEKLDITIKAHKESRSVRQNNMLWSLITLISDEINGEHTEESTMKIYSELLVKANEKYEYMLVLPTAKAILEQQFRAVIDTGQRRVVGDKELHMYKVFIGSSKFNTKEMTNLIETTLIYCSELGIESSEIENIRSEYE